MQSGDEFSSYPTFDDLENHESVFVTKCVKLIASAYDYFADNNRQARDDIYFMHIDPWSAQDRTSRTLQRKPVLNFNMLRPILMQMLGEQRAQQSDIIVEPIDEKSDPKMAKMVVGLLRDQSYQNKSDIHYQESFKYALQGGYSSIFHTIEYTSPKTFDQYVKIHIPQNFSSAFFDPNAKEKDKCDSRFQGFMSDMQRDTFKKTYPDAKTDLSFPTFRNDPLYYNYWYNKDYIRLADLWIKLEYDEVIVQLSDGTSGPKEEMEELISERNSQLRKFKKLSKKIGPNLPPQLQQMIESKEPEALEIIDKRTEVCHKIIHVRLSYNEVLEMEEWPIDIMPGVFHDCHSEIVDGRQLTISFFRNAQDVQRYLNYVKSQSAEALLNLHHLLWLGTPGNVKGDGILQGWKNPQQSKTILLANYDELGNLPTPVPPPQISPSLESQAAMTATDIMNVTGRYEASLGKSGNEKSGIAIDKRNLTSSLASFVPFDNLQEAMTQSAKITLALLEVILKNKKSVAVRDKKGTLSFEKINQKVGEKTYNDVKELKKFNVRIEMGSSFAVQKAANFQMMMSLIQANPQIAPLIADLLADNLDLENSAQIVERLKMMLVPPQILAKEEGKPMPPQDPKQQQMKDAMMQLPIKEMQIKEMRAQQEQESLEIKKAELQHRMKHDATQDEIETARLHKELIHIAATHDLKKDEHHLKIRDTAHAHANANAEHHLKRHQHAATVTHNIHSHLSAKEVRKEKKPS